MALPTLRREEVAAIETETMTQCEGCWFCDDDDKLMTRTNMQGIEASIKKDQRPIRLIENLVTFRELVDDSLKGHFADVTVYKWVRRGLPHRKIRGKLFFSPKEVALWLERTS